METIMLAAAALPGYWQTALIILAVVLVNALLAGVIIFSIVGYLVYVGVLKRKNKEMWGRGPSSDDEGHLIMDAEGMAWHEKNIHRMTPVHVQRDGMNLYGEFYDFGSDKCVMILSGRTESLRYGYYFAQPYAEEGWSVLVVDPRAHGLSDGVYNTIGFEEGKDDLVWAKFLHEKFGINTLVFHGICIGAAGGMYALTSKDCPDYIAGIVTDGMFARFRESMRNNLKIRKKPTIPTLSFINLWMWIFTGHTMNFGPIDVIGNCKKPLLMLQSLEDKASLPAFAQKLYDRCPSENKKIVYFDHGEHSMIRYNNKEKYDQCIKEFLRETF